MSDLDNKADHHLCKTSYSAVSIYLVAVMPCVICPVGKTASEIASRFSKVTLYKPDEERHLLASTFFWCTILTSTPREHQHVQLYLLAAEV